MLKSSCLLVAAMLVIAAVTPRPARAAVIETDQNSAASGSAFAGNISNSDLIETGSAALSGVAYGGTDSVGNTTFPGLTDGTESTATVTNDAYFGRTNSGYDSLPLVPRTATYTFDTVTNARGFDITQINTFDGFSAEPDYADQRYTVYVSFVGTPAVFHLLDDVTYYPFFPFDSTPSNPNPASTEVSLTDGTGILATGVAAIEFVFPFPYDGTTTGPGFEDGQLVQEVDVIGTATTPEPASVALLGLGLLLVLRRRK